MNHYLLFYDVVPDYAERRSALRDAHLEKAWSSHAAGHLVLGGALADPLDGALLLFRAESPETVEAFARQDPYVVDGLVTAWRVRKWSTVAGETAATPIRPAAH